MVQAALLATLRDGEIDARIVQHPFRIVRLADSRFGAEHRRLKADTLVKLVDGNMNVHAFHDLTPSLVEQLGAQAGAHGMPPQQFSVR